MKKSTLFLSVLFALFICLAGNVLRAEKSSSLLFRNTDQLGGSYYRYYSLWGSMLIDNASYYIEHNVQKSYFEFYDLGNFDFLFRLELPRSGYPTIFDEREQVFWQQKTVNGKTFMFRYDLELKVIDSFPAPYESQKFLRFDLRSNPRVALVVPASIEERKKAEIFNFETGEKLKTFSVESLYGWDNADSVIASSDYSSVYVYYPYFGIIYDYETTDSLMTIYNPKSFVGFSPDGEYWFTRDTVSLNIYEKNTRSLFRSFDDSTSINSKFIFLKDPGKIIFKTGDTLDYADITKPFEHKHDFNLDQAVVEYFGDELRVIVAGQYFDFQGRLIYDLNRKSRVPIRFSEDETVFGGSCYSCGDGYSISSALTGNILERTETPVFYDDDLIHGRRGCVDSTLNYYWSGKYKKNIFTFEIVDSLPTSLLDNHISYLFSDYYVNKIAIQHSDGTVQTYDTRSKEIIDSFKCDYYIQKFAPDGSSWVGIVDSNYVNGITGPFNVYDSESKEIILSFSGVRNHITTFGACAYSRDSRNIAFADSTDTLSIFALPSGELVRKYKLNWSLPTALAWANSGNYIYYGSRKGDVACLDLTTGRTKFNYGDLNYSGVKALLVSPKDTYLAAYGAERVLCVWKPDYDFTFVEEDAPRGLKPESVVPNPFSGEVRAACSGSGHVKVRVFDARGELVLTSEVYADTDSESVSVNLGGLPQGIYFFEASSAAGTVRSTGVKVE